MFELNGAADDDALKRCIEEIRGRPISEIEPEGDDWVEVSDETLLCENPVVSVVMLTYNHERFIAQAIESVVTQETTFPFELIIGEDCSTDGTRAICLDYQRRYPNIVRVIYPRENTFKKYGTPVFNLAEVYRRCRGEFCAWCEGDDYWNDVEKLQKQTKVLRDNPDVSFCWTRSKIYYESTGVFQEPAVAYNVQWGRISGGEFAKKLFYRTLGNINTPSYFWRRKPLVELYGKMRFSKWNIIVGDVPLVTCGAAVGDAYRMSDISSVYRVHGTSLCHITHGEVALDNVAISAYFAYLIWGIPIEDFPFLSRAFRFRLLQISFLRDSRRRKEELRQLASANVYRKLLRNKLNWLYYPVALLGRYSVRCHEFVSEGVVVFTVVRVQAIVRMLKWLLR